MKLSPKLKTGLIVVLLIVFFVVLNLIGFSKEVKNLIYLFSQPIQKTFWKVGYEISGFFETVSKMRNLEKVNEELKLKLQELLAENIKLKELKKENETLREALGLKLQEEFKLQFSQVIGRGISSDTILINKGFKDGLSKGLPVITQQKILVGRISEVYKNFSKVMLISNKESSFDAKVEDREIIGVIKGRGNFQVFLDLIPQEKEIREGDIVITTSLGGIFPEGLLVGEIKKVIKSDIEPWQQAKVQPAFNIEGQETLFIILEF